MEVVRSAGGEALSAEVVTRILRRADGVPLFIEELTKSVIETGTAGGDTDIPETLQASLLARLDRLGAEAKEAAQLAAVIGREFSAALLEAVVGKPKNEADRSLQRLVASESCSQPARCKTADMRSVTRYSRTRLTNRYC
jgi:predicted ATPase